MAISLSKGGNVSLSKVAPTLVKMNIGLGWDVRATDGAAFDLDAVVFAQGSNGKVRADNDFIFFNNKNSACGGIIHNGDNLTGAGDGDDEVVTVDLSKLPADLDKIDFCVTIYDADTRKQTFGQVSNAFIRIVDCANNTEVARYDLSEDGSTESALIFSQLYRHNGEWKFKAIGQGFAGGLGPLAKHYGVNV